jgi:hypothetical protein
MNYTHRTHPQFWDCFAALPAATQSLAEKAHDLLESDPFHPSLRLKPVGKYWSVRVGLRHRALAWKQGNVFVWFWIGSHQEYDRLIE